MNKKLLPLALLFLGYTSYSQVGIGTLAPNNSAQLDIVSKNKGVLIPRVALTSTTDNTTISNGNVNSLLVFNTVTQNDVIPAYYYWYEDRWIKFVTTIDIPNNIIVWDVNNNQFTYIDSSGITQIINIEDIVKANESQTQIITSYDLQYYISEAYLAANNGEIPTTIDPANIPAGIYLIDVVGSVVNNFEEIVNNGPVEIDGTIYTTINDYITYLAKSTSGFTKIIYDTTTGDAIFQEWNELTNSWVNVDVMKFKTIVKSNESITQLVKNPDGTYTYYNEADYETNGSLKSGVTGSTIDAAKGANGNIASTLGLVKESAIAPTVAINQMGELSVNLENFNNIKEVSTDYTVTLNDAILLGNASSGDITIVLPNASGNRGKKYTIKKQDDGEDFYVNVIGSINGLSQLYTALPHSGWDLVSDGTTWKIINKF